jgi:ribosomal protein S18 acetylase RimI-like enzyme
MITMLNLTKIIRHYFIISLLVRQSYQFSTFQQILGTDVSFRSSSELNLHRLGLELPLAENMPIESNEWHFHLLESRDLTAASELALEAFYSPRITLSLQRMTGPEKWLWSNLYNFYSAVDQSDTRNGNYLGMRSRSGGRLDNPSFRISTDSFILAATPKNDPTQLAAIVEICIEEPSGKLAPPIANPFRNKAAKASEQPYLCNLCVSKAHRRKGLGKLICELSEELVQIHWNKDIMYLHVEKSNMAAQALYVGMGYELVTPGLSAFEKKMEGMENILYYSNPLKRLWDGKIKDNSVIHESISKSITIDDDSELLGMSQLDMVVASNIMRSKGYNVVD